MATKSEAGDVETVLKTPDGKDYTGAYKRLVFFKTTGYSKPDGVTVHCKVGNSRLCIIEPATEKTDAQGHVVLQGWVFDGRSSPVAVNILRNRIRRLSNYELNVLKEAFGTGPRNFAGLPAELTRVDIPL